ncbi:MAG: polysaccharide deacetylase family protein [Pirellulaceae bacterium]|nr:polysaccharide deacetylase family protein [Pirellulaceae bacterium]
MRFWLLGLFLFFATTLDTNAAETWAQRLGYEAGDRVVILYVDHMGASYETNIAGINALSAGQATSTSVKVPCPWFEQFAVWSRSHHDKDVGVSLTLNSPSKVYRWRPLTGDYQSSTLIDAHGYFWATPHQAAIRVDRDQVEAELVMQIERARKSGIHPSHIIPAMGTMFMRPDLLDLYLNLAEKYWIPAVVVELTPDHVERFAGRGFPITEDMQMLLQRYPLPKLDDIKFLEDTTTYPQRLAELAEAIGELKPGLTQIMFAPAIESDSLKAITPRWQQLVWDSKLLADPLTKALLKQEGVRLTNWREVMQRFEKGVNPNSTRGR